MSFSEKIRPWMAEAACPLWGGAGIDPATGGVWEALRVADGAPARAEIKRVRVQHRQIYAFAEAWRMGLDPQGLERARGVLAFARARAQAPRGAGWIHRLNPDDSPQDSRRDSYDQMFALLGYGALARFGVEEAREDLARTWAGLSGDLAHPLGGWREDDLDRLPRRQNPHMHGFEACLALQDWTGEAVWMERAEAVLDLFFARFFDAGRGWLLEHFAEDWTPLTPEEGQRLEPGHFCEWVWLLRRYERLGGRRPVGAAADALYAEGRRLGLGPDGLLCDETFLDGSPSKSTRRLWGQTEHFKAALAQERVHGTGRHLAEAREIFDRLFGVYLTGCHPGGWRDRLNPDGSLADPLMPASTFYHLVCAFGYALDWETAKG